MKYKNSIIVLGVLIAITLSPFIGIPKSWKEGIAIILGLTISALAYTGNRVKTDRPSMLSSVMNKVNPQIVQTKPVETEVSSGDAPVNSQ